MTETVYQAVFDGLADWEVGHATAHINNGQWHKEPGRYRVATVGATTEPVTTMGGVRVVPDVTLEADRSVVDRDARPAGRRRLDDRRQPAPSSPRPSSCSTTASRSPRSAGPRARSPPPACSTTDRTPATRSSSCRRSATADPSHYVDEPAVTDGDLITGSGTAPVEFAREVFARLDLYEPHILAAWYKLYGLNDPAGFYELNGMAAP